MKKVYEGNLFLDVQGIPGVLVTGNDEVTWDIRRGVLHFRIADFDGWTIEDHRPESVNFARNAGDGGGDFVWAVFCKPAFAKIHASESGAQVRIVLTPATVEEPVDLLYINYVADETPLVRDGQFDEEIPWKVVPEGPPLPHAIIMVVSNAAEKVAV